MRSAILTWLSLLGPNLQSSVVELDARDSAIMFSIVFDSPATARRAIHISEPRSDVKLQLGATTQHVVLRRGQCLSTWCLAKA